MLTLLFVQRFRRSRLGTSALMVQMNPDLAQALGVDARSVRFLVFVASAPISALAGWLYAYQRAYVGPDMFESYFLVLMLTAIVIVGRRLLLGPLIGTALIIVQQTFFSIGGDGDKIVLGAVLAAILLLWPAGMIGVWELLRARSRRTTHKGGSMLTFYLAPGSSSMAPNRPARNRRAFEARPISFASKDRAPDFLALNPEGKVPTLLIDGRPLTEVAAILFYLARRTRRRTAAAWRYRSRGAGRLVDVVHRRDHASGAPPGHRACRGVSDRRPPTGQRDGRRAAIRSPTSTCSASTGASTTRCIRRPAPFPTSMPTTRA